MVTLSQATTNVMNWLKANMAIIASKKHIHKSKEKLRHIVNNMIVDIKQSADIAHTAADKTYDKVVFKLLPSTKAQITSMLNNLYDTKSAQQIMTWADKNITPVVSTWLKSLNTEELRYLYNRYFNSAEIKKAISEAISIGVKPRSSLFNSQRKSSRKPVRKSSRKPVRKSS